MRNNFRIQKMKTTMTQTAQPTQPRRVVLRPLFSMLLCAGVFGLNACTVGPDYKRTEVVTPQAYKESIWKIAQPNDAYVHEAWWKVYQDEQLNGLVEVLNNENNNIAQAEAQYRQADAILRQAQAGLFPSLGLNAGITRGALSSASNSVTTSNSLTGSVAWQLDLWGSVRRTVEAGNAGKDAAMAHVQYVKLSMQAQLVTAYLQLRIADQQIADLSSSQKNLEEANRIIKNQYNAGTVSDAELSLSESQLKTAQAAVVDIKLSRTLLEHAISTVLGKVPAEFSITPSQQLSHLPTIPASIPSELLERRPDIAESERNVAQANAKVGVAQAAFFPNLSLSASGGFRSSVLSDLISLPNRIWSIGPSIAMSIFDAGLRSAQKAQAVATYDQTVAAYRQVVLTAFQAVEDNLAAQAFLRQESDLLEASLRAAQRSETIAMNQYRAGTVSYINVLTTQNTRIAAQNSLWNLRNRQYTSSVALIAALGGKW